MNSNLEDYAKKLEQSDQYKVIRKLSDFQPRTIPQGVVTRQAVLVDLETTGLDAENFEIIEIGMVSFIYGADDGRIYEVAKGYQAFQQPSQPIPEQITNITGITDSMVAGQNIDLVEVGKILDESALVLAHNARFDRPFCHQLSDKFAEKAWGCSMSQIDWASEGYEGVKLKYLATETGFFYDGHRAVDDCLATIGILDQVLPASEQYAMKALLKNAREKTLMISAVDAPFAMKDHLKARGYHWVVDGYQKAWTKEVLLSESEAEMAFLESEIYQRSINIPTTEITPITRFL